MRLKTRLPHHPTSKDALKRLHALCAAVEKMWAAEACFAFLPRDASKARQAEVAERSLQARSAVLGLLVRNGWTGAMKWRRE